MVAFKGEVTAGGIRYTVDVGIAAAEEEHAEGSGVAVCVFQLHCVKHEGDAS